jgi:hypothetical protein
MGKKTKVHTVESIKKEKEEADKEEQSLWYEVPLNSDDGADPQDTLGEEPPGYSEDIYDV